MSDKAFEIEIAKIYSYLTPSEMSIAFRAWKAGVEHVRNKVVDEAMEMLKIVKAENNDCLAYTDTVINHISDRVELLKTDSA